MTKEEARRYMLQWQQELKDGGVLIDSDRIQALRVAIEALREPSGETVSKGVYLQTKWERDTALQTLEEHGIGLGQKADRPQGEWNPYYTKRENNDIFNCQLCGTTFIVMQGKDNMNFCPNCGTRMDHKEK